MRKKVSRITTKKLAELIQNSINSYFASQNNNNEKPNIRIEGSIPSIPSFINIYHNDHLIKQLIDENCLNEGLIKTYPIEKVIKLLTRKFQLSPDQIQIETTEFEDIPIKCITLFFPLNIDKNTIGDIKHEMNTCGYFVAQDLFHDILNNISYILFEPKYTQDVSDIIRSKYSVLYHMTSSLFINKIKNNGLCPSSKNSTFLYPKRVFFMKGDTLNDEQKYMLNTIKQIRDNSDNAKQNPFYNQQAYLLTLDLNKIPKDVKMYADPFTSPGSFFTYDNIPPSAIINIEPFNA